MSKKGQHHEEHEEHVNHEAWVIPYADLLTLLMAMFLALWAVGQTDLAKFQQLADGFSSALGTSGSSTPALVVETPSEPQGEVVSLGDGTMVVLPDMSQQLPIPPDASAETRQRVEEFNQARSALEREQSRAEAIADESARLDEAERRIRAHAEAVGLADKVSFRRELRGLVVTVVSDEVLFAPGSSQLLVPGTQILDGLAASLVGLDNTIAVEGHADSQPISTLQFPSNWELSTARASSTVRYLIDRHGLSSNKIRAAGFGDTQPLAPNETPEGRALNRRVEIVVESAIAADVNPFDVTTPPGEN